MRIVVLLDRWQPRGGGLERYLGEVLPALASRHDLFLVARDAGRATPPGFTAVDASSRLPLPRPWRDLADARALARAARCLRPDAVLSLRSIPLAGACWQPHTPPAEELRRARGRARPRLRDRILEDLEERSLAAAGTLLALSPRLAASFRARRPGLETLLLPPPVLVPVAPALRPLAQRPRRFLWCGRDARLKGAEVALAWFRELAPESGARLEMWSRSRSHLERALRRPAASLEPEGVVLRGWDPAFPAALEDAEVLLHPTRADACSLVCLEAAARGLAVLTTPANGLAALLGEPWLAVVPPGRPGAAAEGLRRLQGGREDLGDRGRREAQEAFRERFAPETHLERLEPILTHP